ncbi:hypothetical protein F2Q69_00036263 [Brassica cretica]|uniref:Uncharacterized protein n=1 Tax=Brassica cretica TaxID=69181 RepID=A0A8S9SEY6_BRACR|nr:hypothetical protein F2Q69_00036263 [Brassica cretica]
MAGHTSRIRSPETSDPGQPLSEKWHVHSGTSTVARPQKIKMAKAHRDSTVASFRAAECEIRTEPSTDYLKETDTYPNQPRTNRTTDKPSLVAMHSSQAWSLCTQAKLGRYAATVHAHGLVTEFEPSLVAT